MRVVGRIRCRDPLEAGEGERLVAFHRDVEVMAGGRWRSVERLRETRSFELWDHDGSLTVDPAGAAEPLVAIPKVWRGDASQLEEPHASAVARLAERHGVRHRGAIGHPHRQRHRSAARRRPRRSAATTAGSGSSRRPAAT